MEFFLNETFGINGITEISLRKVIDKFGVPDEREIQRESELKNITVNYTYKERGLRIFYNICYFVEKEGVDFHTMSFIVEKLYLTKELFLINDEDIRNSLSKIRKYHKNVKKEFEFEFEEHNYGGSYIFPNIEITIFFEKNRNRKYLDGIYVGLPIEDNPEIPSVEEIMYME